MSENKELKKVSLADAIRRKLDQKKQQSASGQTNTFQAGSAKQLKNQNNTKPTTQRRRAGSS
ncbi:hypothetical protein PMSD_11585 [Paenibacillus macquariensis subsp. defensor]|uniref:YfhD-like protein n=1 Tax=Paenibacillus macquariensis TaxID=948756 RepID=A0ABY1K8F5_9BACL|nr:hypothetical protein [Paenibacillus macquariensis]MEC0093269.1 hypothetical protein [Paenibacillus macquariensis]OAB27566.1 hypothetical protein PMSM_25195 [Paenibacillus macquariensis subsp. macquariensis]OAB36931.1 hypothetical protein PMSD_11585 [Paenibacillus macquariensis subsp. defensor]SIR41017.1 hypothetical protein SAMN05421578_11345 [Paenibacillus macquariensis]